MCLVRFVFQSLLRENEKDDVGLDSFSELRNIRSNGRSHVTLHVSTVTMRHELADAFFSCSLPYYGGRLVLDLQQSWLLFLLVLVT
jgi:hypothetical protein